MAQQYGLGRGLSSLIPPRKTTEPPKGSPFSYPDSTVPSAPVGDSVTASASAPVPRTRIVPSRQNEDGEVIAGALEIPVASIVPNPHQPRMQFDDAKLAELAESIKEHGILQPITVTKLPDGTFELIAGERRYQAGKLAGLKAIPALVREAGEREKLELAIIENTQRHDLNPIEEAKAYLRLTDEFGLSQDAVSRKVSKSRSAVANTLRLLSLPIEIQRALAEGKITEGHAKALLSIENAEKQRALFELIVKGGMTVRETEAKVREISVRPHTRVSRSADPDLLAKENALAERLKTKVKIVPVGAGGRVVIEFYSKEELGGLCEKLSETP
jgi:ParB family chromosome partitioning protein